MIDFNEFYRGCNPANTLNIEKPEDRKVYIDFSSVRGGEVVKKLKNQIKRMHPDATCQLFTGHIGCGKSTELLRLKSELEESGFVVVYYDSSEDLDMADIDVSDILLAIAQQVMESLDQLQVKLEPGYFSKLLQECVGVLTSEIEIGHEMELNPAVSLAGAKMSLGKITTKMKENPKNRSRLRDYLESKTTSLLDAINKELIEPGNTRLQAQGKKGLVVIVDSLDKIDNRPMSSGSKKSLPEYLFSTRGKLLKGLHCHLVYTIPLVLMFSNEKESVENNMTGGMKTKVLPMVPIKFSDETPCPEGLEKLRQLVLARAFPDGSPSERLELITEVFDQPETLDRLCQISGGHVRKLLALLFQCLQEEDELPITRETLEWEIQQQRDQLTNAIDLQEWKLLRQVAKTKKITPDKQAETSYETLLRSLFVFEYNFKGKGQWFEVNPVLMEADEMEINIG